MSPKRTKITVHLFIPYSCAICMPHLARPFSAEAAFSHKKYRAIFSVTSLRLHYSWLLCQWNCAYDRVIKRAKMTRVFSCNKRIFGLLAWMWCPLVVPYWQILWYWVRGVSSGFKMPKKLQLSLPISTVWVPTINVLPIDICAIM